jgi:hypothetical protein
MKELTLASFFCRTKQTTHYLVKKDKPLPIVGPIPAPFNAKKSTTIIE